MPLSLKTVLRAGVLRSIRAEKQFSAAVERRFLTDNAIFVLERARKELAGTSEPASALGSAFFNGFAFNQASIDSERRRWR